MNFHHNFLIIILTLQNQYFMNFNEIIFFMGKYSHYQATFKVIIPNLKVFIYSPNFD